MKNKIFVVGQAPPPPGGNNSFHINSSNHHSPHINGGNNYSPHINSSNHHSPGRTTRSDPKNNSNEIWRWGLDNRFPEALAMLSRSSTIHRRIINDKADYISGSGLSADPTTPRTTALVREANSLGQSLRTVIQRIALDRCLFGNAFLEIITDPRQSFLSLCHQDATRCRLAKTEVKNETQNETQNETKTEAQNKTQNPATARHILLHHNWSQYRPSEARRLPLWPAFEEQPDGTHRSVIHYKDYEPGFEHYGIPKYIAGLGASAIIWKTDRWNLSRLDNSFQPSGVMILDGETDTDEEAAAIARLAEERFAGQPGQVMFLVKNSVSDDTTRFVPMNTGSDGDWKSLHDQAVADLIVAHSWFRTLSGMEYSTGFSADRVRHEYNIALTTLIRVEQQEIIEPLHSVIREILGEDPTSLVFTNRPPFDQKPGYMHIWEARKADGLPYDPNDPAQQIYLSQI